MAYNTAVYFSRVTHCVFLSSCPKFYTCSLHGQIKYYIQLESGFLLHMDITVSQLHIYVVGPLNGFSGSGVSTLSSYPHYLCRLKWIFFKHLNVDLTHALAWPMVVIYQSAHHPWWFVYMQLRGQDCHFAHAVMTTNAVSQVLTQCLLFLPWHILWWRLNLKFWHGRCLSGPHTVGHINSQFSESFVCVQQNINPFLCSVHVGIYQYTNLT